MRDNMDSITVFDVETADARNSRICQIGIVRLDSGLDVIDAQSWLVDPEAPFGQYQMQVHDIRPRDVYGKPTFGDLWDSELHAYFPPQGYVVGHNVKFDLAVLDKCCAHYGYKMPQFNVIDTVNMAKQALPYLKGKKLNLVADALGVELSHHHDALSDTIATADILRSMVDMGTPFSWRVWEPKHAQIDQAPREQVKQLSFDDLSPITTLEFR